VWGSRIGGAGAWSEADVMSSMLAEVAAPGAAVARRPPAALPGHHSWKPSHDGE
jgi:hypothetical protein